MRIKIWQGRLPPLVCLLIALLAIRAFAASAPADADRSKQLVAVLQSTAPLAERARACQQLAIVGTAEAIPALSALLADDKLANYARDALEVMPDPAAGAALRAALGSLQGNFQIGVVNSIDMRRDVDAIDALSRIATSPDSVASAPALLALGRIATPAVLVGLKEALRSVRPETRAAAAEGTLLYAERLRGTGLRAAAGALFDQVREAAVPAPLRVTATRGAILAREAGGLPLLMEQLRANDPELRDMALLTSRELRGPGVGPALVAELDRAPASLQSLLIAALVDRGETSAIPALEKRAAGSDAEVRVEALKALGTLGRASSLPILLRALSEQPSGTVISGIASASLARCAAAETDAFLLDALRTAEPTIRIRLIGVLAERKSERAVDEMMKLAGSTEAATRQAAFRALGLLAAPRDLQRLIELALATPDEVTRTLADRAIVTTSMKVLEPERRAEAVLTALRGTRDANTRRMLLRPLGAIVRSMGGSHDAYFVVRDALQDSAEAVRHAAVECLADWPDAAPTMTLLEWANKSAETSEREIALRGAIRMATVVASGRERSPLNVVAAYTQANRLVKTTEAKLMIVSALGNLRRMEAVEMLRPYLDDPEVQPEAALALVQIAPALSGSRGAATLAPLLERIAATEKDEDVRRKAARLAKGGPVPPAKTKAGKQAAVAAPPAERPGVLFNGQDLGRWDGDPGIWRVREGTIVGGSLTGNPRNEFLATTRSYRNFALRVEYKLVGSEGFVNGGVQFRSVRIAQPPNEMSGYQADIGAGHSGCLYDESRRKKFLMRATDEQIKRLEKPGDWNRYEIRCEGPRVMLALNGEQTVAYTEDDASVAPAGLVALQIHGNCKAEISFRNVMIEELP